MQVTFDTLIGQTGVTESQNYNSNSKVEKRETHFQMKRNKLIVLDRNFNITLRTFLYHVKWIAHE